MGVFDVTTCTYTMIIGGDMIMIEEDKIMIEEDMIRQDESNRRHDKTRVDKTSLD